MGVLEKLMVEWPDADGATANSSLSSSLLPAAKVEAEGFDTANAIVPADDNLLLMFTVASPAAAPGEARKKLRTEESKVRLNPRAFSSPIAVSSTGIPTIDPACIVASPTDTTRFEAP